MRSFLNTEIQYSCILYEKCFQEFSTNFVTVERCQLFSYKRISERANRQTLEELEDILNAVEDDPRNT